jgi:hypothetical protein
MDDVANECGISKKTIYKHFENKNDLLHHAIENQVNKLEINLKTYPGKFPNAVISLKSFFDNITFAFNKISPAFVREIKKFYPNIYIEILKLKNTIILPFIKENINQGKKEKLYKNNLIDDEFSKSYNIILNMIFMNSFSTNSKEEQHQSIVFFNNLFLHRLVSIKGLNELNKINLKIDNNP